MRQSQQRCVPVIARTAIDKKVSEILEASPRSSNKQQERNNVDPQRAAWLDMRSRWICVSGQVYRSLLCDFSLRPDHKRLKTSPCDYSIIIMMMTQCDTCQACSLVAVMSCKDPVSVMSGSRSTWTLWLDSRQLHNLFNNLANLATNSTAKNTSHKLSQPVMFSSCPLAGLLHR